MNNGIKIRGENNIRLHAEVHVRLIRAGWTSGSICTETYGFGIYLSVIPVSFCSNITFVYSSEVPPLILIQIRHLKYLKAAAGSKQILG